MNGYNFTDRVRKVLQMAREEAARLHHEYVGTEHILLGLIREGEGVAAAVLTNLGVELEEVQQKIEETVKKGKAAAAAGPELPYTSRAKKVLELAMMEARELNHSYVGTEHLLLGLLREEKGIAAQVLADAGITLEQARAETLRLLGSDMPQPPASSSSGSSSSKSESGGPQAVPPKSEKKSKTPALDHFCRDLTALAAEDALDPDHRPRHRDRARDGDSRAPQEEQSRADRRTRRRQDGDRRGAGPARGKRSVSRRAARPPRALARHGRRHCRHQVSRPVRGAPQGGDERDRPEQERDAVHRRAAHPGRCRCGRGCHRCVEHAEARARARRAAVRRCVDPQRVSQVHREGRRARAALPDGHGRTAQRGRDGRDPQGSSQEVRGAPPHHDSRRDDSRGRGDVGPLHHRPVPAGQGDRRDRRGWRARTPRVAAPARRGGRAQDAAREGHGRQGRGGA